MMRKIALLILFVLIVPAVVIGESYSIRPGDELTITVREAPDFSGVYIVSEEGNINFPEVGSVAAKDKSIGVIAADIKAGLEKSYLTHANVMVRISRYTPIRYFILGYVSNPGAFEVLPGTSVTVLQAIALAGGLREDADAKKITIIRKGSDKILLDLSAAFEEGDASNDCPLLEDDILMVIKKEERTAYVLGAVSSGGRVDFPSKVQTLPLAVVLALAGGIDAVFDGEVQIFPKDALGIVNPRTCKLTEKGLSREDMAVEVAPGETVFVLDRKTKIYVLGKVNTPGAIPYRKGITISEVVALSGGLASGAAENRTRLITTNSNGSRTVREVNLVKILSPADGDSFTDIELLPWTIIMIPESRL